MHRRGRAIIMSLVDRLVIAAVCASIIWYSCNYTVSCITGDDATGSDPVNKKAEPTDDKTTRTDNTN